MKSAVYEKAVQQTFSHDARQRRATIRALSRFLTVGQLAGIPSGYAPCVQCGRARDEDGDCLNCEGITLGAN